jgi:xylulokinase
MNKRYLLGFDIGSSSVKASLVDVETGEISATAFYPEKEAPITGCKGRMG